MEESRILVQRDDARIESLNVIHEAFVINANRIVEMVKEELQLSFDFNAEFLLKVFKGEVKLKGEEEKRDYVNFGAYAPQGFFRYRQIISETEIYTRFGGNGLVLDLAAALRMYKLPEFSVDLAEAMSSCFQGLKANVDLRFVAIEDNRFVFSESGKREIESKYSRELLGEDVVIYNKFASIAGQLTELIKEVNGGNMPFNVTIDNFLDFDRDENGEVAVLAVPTCVPSELERMGALRVAMYGGRAPEHRDSEGEANRLFRELNGKFLQ
ncbi:hypothetical protein Oweho_3250 [Owenweeksia hongkongensis DSM 17368]|uniref:Uncharacterized protein n=1 Tax=Owenweeksia hongkongensis (strain DSM 17368 / CIP 108786 / JCM 12287 / NRRL B-23963 / UST20020801) TaxID=926562 RepID=G8R4A1_OWEHD|nr:hypothetical protein [Owenweeksia hongkongensis]AEV34201.1 hypothetical protein Oweho_3250 [Owenweeksia hongkongensis DSM 17368]